jgi:hypothetical protein
MLSRWLPQIVQPELEPCQRSWADFVEHHAERARDQAQPDRSRACIELHHVPAGGDRRVDCLHHALEQVEVVLPERARRKENAGAPDLLHYRFGPGDVVEGVAQDAIGHVGVAVPKGAVQAGPQTLREPLEQRRCSRGSRLVADQDELCARAGALHHHLERSDQAEVCAVAIAGDAQVAHGRFQFARDLVDQWMMDLARGDIHDAMAALGEDADLGAPDPTAHGQACPVPEALSRPDDEVMACRVALAELAQLLRRQRRRVQSAKARAPWTRRQVRTGRLSEMLQWERGLHRQRLALVLRGDRSDGNFSVFP